MIGLAAIVAATGVVFAAAADSGPTEESLRAADMAQLEAGARSDPAATEAIQHPNYLGNAPNNRVVDAATVRRLMASGQIASDAFKRQVERVAVTGDVGVVMGREEIVAAKGSISKDMFASGPLVRRFTNVYLFEGGRWRLLARHANVVAPPKSE